MAGRGTLEALHLASAVTFQAVSGLTILFMTADVRQRKAAEMLAINMIWWNKLVAALQRTKLEVAHYRQNHG
ncbi:MAG: hypothetical protein P0119_11025 [Nitrospira sp.]|nr:hypothetical protein [Nitrospira sp.]